MNRLHYSGGFHFYKTWVVSRLLVLVPKVT